MVCEVFNDRNIILAIPRYLSAHRIDISSICVELKIMYWLADYGFV